MAKPEKKTLASELITLEDLILSYRSDIILIATEFSLPGIEVDDLVGEAFVALIELSESALEAESSWEDIAIRAMQDFIMNELTKRRGLKDLQISEYRLTLPDQGLSVEDLFLKGELMAMIQGKIDALSPRYADVLLGHVLDGRTFTEIAEEIQALSFNAREIREGVLSRSRVGQICQSALKSVKNSIFPLLRPAYGREDDPYDLRQRVLQVVEDHSR